MRSRFPLILAGAGVLLLLVAAMFVLPFRIAVSVVPAVQPVEAGLPTTTPAPPTATPAPAASTPIPTAPPPPAATATPNVPPPAATATPDIPPPTDVPSTTEKKDRPTPPALEEPSPTPPLPLMEPSPTPDVPQVVLTKSVSARRFKPGDTVTYKLTINNTGRGIAHDVVVTDQVPNMLQVVDLRTGKGDIVVDGQTVRAFPRTINPDESVTYTITVRVREGTKPMIVTNTGIVTISDGGDDPGDNSSSTDIEIVNDPKPAPKQPAPTKLPVTADPNDMGFVQQYWPLLMMIVMLMSFGVYTRRGAFQAQLMRVTVGTPAQPASQPTPTVSMSASQDVVLDPQAILAAWNSGTPTSQIVSEVARKNPHLDRARVSIAVQSVLNRR